MQAPQDGVKGVVFVDTCGTIALSRGIGTDRRIHALVQDKDWMDEARRKRLQPLTLDRVKYALLISCSGYGDLVIVSAAGDAVMDFVGSVDFAYDVFEHLLSDPFEAMTVVDRHKRLAYISPVHEGFFGLGRGEANGRQVREVIENTRLDRVVDTGRPEIGQVQRMKGCERVVTRIPIKRDGDVVGAIGRIMFKGPDQLESMARQINALESNVEYYRREVQMLRDRTYGLESLIGDSPAMRKLRAQIVKVAPLEIPLLITGESGTGKELVAHALHRLSPRRDGSLVMLNAAALPATLVESELFGYEPGAFTGANKKGRKGKFEQASEGTLFLDEIGDMPVDLQVKLLRVLQDHMVERLGGDAPQQVDFRLVSATNRDLRQLVAEKSFRLDLYYRISAITIEVPPLRARLADVPDLARQFLANVSERHARPAPQFTDDALSFLMEQRWPGNVRQLRHEVERAFVFAEGDQITADILSRSDDGWHEPASPVAPPFTIPNPRPTTMQAAVAQVETEVIRQAMTRLKGNKKRVASELGISRSYLYKVLDLHKIE